LNPKIARFAGGFDFDFDQVTEEPGTDWQSCRRRIIMEGSIRKVKLTFLECFLRGGSCVSASSKHQKKSKKF